MASAQVVETSVNNNSPSQDSYHPDDLFQSRYATPGFKPFSYITSLFKQVHITQGSRVADHCAVYALSDPKEDYFQGTCDHAHDQSCSSCEGLDSVLSSIEASVRHKTSNLLDEERDDMMYSCQQAVQAIHTWKAHQLRVLQQDKCRIDVLQ